MHFVQAFVLRARRSRRKSGFYKHKPKRGGSTASILSGPQIARERKTVYDSTSAASLAEKKQ
jgi:hypothetical protein